EVASSSWWKSPSSSLRLGSSSLALGLTRSSWVVSDPGDLGPGVCRGPREPLGEMGWDEFECPSFGRAGHGPVAHPDRALGVHHLIALQPKLDDLLADPAVISQGPHPRAREKRDRNLPPDVLRPAGATTTRVHEVG